MNIEKKHWTEPNGNFIMQIPLDWQYRNPVFDSIEDIKSPYSFELYEDPLGCFQISCYPLLKERINNKQPVQNNNSQIKWLYSRMDSKEFDMLLFHAQVDDLMCMVKYIYSEELRCDKRIMSQIEIVHWVLSTIRVIPKEDRKLARNLDKHDNFLGSLLASQDLLNKALEKESYIEVMVILAGQIDALLRSSIVLKKQLLDKTDDIDIKYIYQKEYDKGITERKIFRKAHEMTLINDQLFDKLNELYNIRNRVIHRYIISYIKTRDIINISCEYLEVIEEVRSILNGLELSQMGTGFGIYGRGFDKDHIIDIKDLNLASAMVNDKHLLKKLFKEL